MAGEEGWYWNGRLKHYTEQCEYKAQHTAFKKLYGVTGRWKWLYFTMESG